MRKRALNNFKVHLKGRSLQSQNHMPCNCFDKVKLGFSIKIQTEPIFLFLLVSCQYPGIFVVQLARRIPLSSTISWSLPEFLFIPGYHRLECTVQFATIIQHAILTIFFTYWDCTNPLKEMFYNAWERIWTFFLIIKAIWTSYMYTETTRSILWSSCVRRVTADFKDLFFKKRICLARENLLWNFPCICFEEQGVHKETWSSGYFHLCHASFFNHQQVLISAWKS